MEVEHSSANNTSEGRKCVSFATLSHLALNPELTENISWASLVVQLIKNRPAMQETLVQFLGWRRSPGEGIGYPLQYSWASLVAQMVRNQLAVLETRVWSLGWEDLLEQEMVTHPSILAWRIPRDRGKTGGLHGVTKSGTWLSD